VLAALKAFVQVTFLGCSVRLYRKLHMHFFAESLGWALARGAFPSLRTLSFTGKEQTCVDDEPYLEELVASLQDGWPCCTTLVRVELDVHCYDLAHLPRLVAALAGLPRLEYVGLAGYVRELAALDHLDGKKDWRVEGGREVLLGLRAVLAGLEGTDNQEELQSSIRGVLHDLYAM
jgi:hypothetical protein